MQAQVEAAQQKISNSLESVGNKLRGALELAGVGLGVGEIINTIEQHEAVLAQLDAVINRPAALPAIRAASSRTWPKVCKK